MAADEQLLDAVRAAAEAAVEAQLGDGDEADALEHSRATARAALDGGHGIAVIAKAESEGERAARERLGAHVLRSVERSAKKLREVTTEYERAVARAVGIGLPARDVAARAGVSHGTVSAVARRVAKQPSAPVAGPAAEGEQPDGDGGAVAVSDAV